MGAGAAALVDVVAHGDVGFVRVVHGQVLGDVLVDAPLQLEQVDLRRAILEVQDEAVVDVVVLAAGDQVGIHVNLAQILRRVGHQAVGQGLMYVVDELLRLRAEHGRAADDDLLAHADHQVCVAGQQRIDQVEVLHDHALAQIDGLHDRVGQDVGLGEAGLEADVQVVGVGRVEAAHIAHVQDRQRAHVHAVVVVGQLQAGEHAAHQRALAGARVADEADQLVVGAEVELGNLHAQVVDAGASAGRKEGCLNQALLHAMDVGHERPPNRAAGMPCGGWFHR